MVALIENHALETKPFMSLSPKAGAAQEAIKVQGRRYAKLRDEAGDIDVLRDILKNMIADSEKLMHTLVQQQSTASAEPFEVHERRIETLQANVAQYRLQSLHLELDDGALGNEGWDEQERSSWLKLCE
ncbi:hypothetical protein DIS24_g10728 [Lasiodiplodia hormozganensis]|uniref:Uncharacterized protein n=1 Tax=Lasiodiplodia hormozganensis TaxID=869390 RepID=A0AA39XPQ2_9PEZI|nr:hypothetical protein DIS24_g10728 [Lasiodiplodia hormozganensis]